MARKPLPLMDPFVHLAGSTWLVMDYYDFHDPMKGPAAKQPDSITLRRLTPKEERAYHGSHIHSVHEIYAKLITKVRRRLGYAKPHDTDSKEKK